MKEKTCCFTGHREIRDDLKTLTATVDELLWKHIFSDKCIVRFL